MASPTLTALAMAEPDPIFEIHRQDNQRFALVEIVSDQTITLVPDLCNRRKADHTLARWKRMFCSPAEDAAGPQ